MSAADIGFESGFIYLGFAEFYLTQKSSGSATDFYLIKAGEK